MNYDVIISGGGPAGSTCALFCAKNGLRVLLLEKERFPRDKTCADNKSWICTSIVKELGLWQEFLKLPKAEITKMLFSTPSGNEVTLELDEQKIAADGPHYNVRRMVFDNFLFQTAKKQKSVSVIENFVVKKTIIKNGVVVGVEGTFRGKKKQFFAGVVVGADGSESIVAKSSGINPVVRERHALSARAYYSDVAHDENTVELHYLKGVSPGYFWIFPVDGGRCNVGVGIPTTQVESNKLDLPRLLEQIVSSPKFSSRFKKARRVSQTKQWGITIGGKRKKICGNGFLLVGDAANTAVTFAGEGVGPAMRSAKIAAKTIVAAVREKDFSQESLSRYEGDLWKAIGAENKAMRRLEFLATHTLFFDFAVKKAAKSKKLRDVAASIANDYANAGSIFRFSTLLELLKP